MRSFGECGICSPALDDASWFTRWWRLRVLRCDLPITDSGQTGPPPSSGTDSRPGAFGGLSVADRDRDSPSGLGDHSNRGRAIHLLGIRAGPPLPMSRCESHQPPVYFGSNIVRAKLGEITK